MKASVIIPTYNRPAALRLCLLSLMRQTVDIGEAIIADDGSRAETRQVINEFAQPGVCPFPLRHVWQEDMGFRKPRIINEAVRNACGDYLIFIDGDCMAHPEFIRSHRLFAEPSAILGGKRIDLGQELTASLLEKGKPLTSLTWLLLWDSVVNDTRKAEEALRIENPLLRRLFKRGRITDDGIWGCNFSLPKELFYAINGCDEDFLDGSIEDNDLGIRVLNNGGKVKSVRSLAIVFHLWHQASWGFSSEKYFHNKQILEKRIATRQKFCTNGIMMRGQDGPGV